MTKTFRYTLGFENGPVLIMQLNNFPRVFVGPCCVVDLGMLTTFLASCVLIVQITSINHVDRVHFNRV
jgi:hypothetical protein